MTWPPEAGAALWNDGSESPWAELWVPQPVRRPWLSTVGVSVFLTLFLSAGLRWRQAADGPAPARASWMGSQQKQMTQISWVLNV